MSLSYNNPVDIGNRGLQHLGAKRMNITEGFNEVSKNAKSIAFVYDKVREAELRRNAWSFASRRVILRALDVGTRFIAPSLYSSTQTYFPNAVVADVSGMLWISMIPDNVGNAPGQSPAWEAYFGPLSVDRYDSTTTYSSGELVYIAPGDGTYKVYMSLVNANAVDPSVPVLWSSTAVYTKDTVISYTNGRSYMSLTDLNSGQVPTASPAPWNAGTAYIVGNTAGGSDGQNYVLIASSDTGHDPTTDGGVRWSKTGALTSWLDVTTSGFGSDQYLAIGVALLPQAPVYPIGAGPVSNTQFKNAFRLPAGFLKLLPQNPKPGNGILGGPVGNVQKDWIKEGDYIISNDVGPISVRFTANITLVTSMDVMFCEGLAARLGIECCEELTQSDGKITVCEQLYGKWMGDARTVNAIEADETFEPDEDEFIACRL